MTMGWQPIETAPKDGTRILIWERGKKGGGGCWITAWWTCYSPFYRSEVAGWWTSSDPHRAHVALPEDVTHWQPLPNAPA